MNSNPKITSEQKKYFYSPFPESNMILLFQSSLKTLFSNL